MRDLKNIKQKYKEIVDKESNAGGNNLDKYVQLKDGKHTVRILPGATENDMFYSETALHYVTIDKKQSYFHCLRIHGKPCPLCELYFALWKEDQGGGTEADEALGRKIKPGPRYYYNVIDRKDDDKVKILSVGKKLFGKITKEIIQFAESVDEEGDAQEPIDLLSLKDGCDFIVDKKEIGGYPNYDDSKFRRKQTKAGVADALEQLHNLEELVRLEDYDKVRTAALSVAPHMSHLFSGVDPSNMEETDEVDSKDYAEQLEG